VTKNNKAFLHARVLLARFGPSLGNENHRYAQPEGRHRHDPDPASCRVAPAPLAVSRACGDLGRKRFGDEGAAREELVAELGSAFLCADLNLTPEVREDHAAYIATWITVLKGDTRAREERAAA
jgi:hypothetical protein